MRRRRALFTVMVVLTAGCAGVLGLEDRRLEAEAGDAGNADGRSDLADGPPSDSGADATAPIDAADERGPCNPAGAMVYAVVTDSGGIAYVPDASVVPGASGATPAFMLLSPDEPFDGSVPFYVQADDKKSDYVVTFRMDKEADAYSRVADLPNIYRPDSAPPPGAKPIVRAVSDAGTQHKVFFEGESQLGWRGEHLWYICPLP